jgi:RNA polymerase sigma factor (sigma-70 family)
MEASALRRSRAALPGSRRLLAALGDDRLVEQVRRGNEAAFEVIFDRHYRGILSFCRHMLGSREEAEDAVQQTFASAYTDLQSNDREIRLKAWLYTIARNRCLSILRARREQVADLNDEDLPTAGLSEQVQQRADLKELLQDLRELPDDQREALVLFEIGDLSQAEVANVIGVDSMKVKALVFQARSSLIENRDARAIPCVEIREQLATATGGALRRGPLRRHLKACEGCREYADQVKTQRRALAAILPVVPTVGFKQSVLAAIGFGGGAGGGGAAAGGGVATSAAGVGANAAGGGSGLVGAFASIGGVGAAKLAVGATLGVGALVGGGVAIERATSDGPADTAEAADDGGAKGTPVRTGNPGIGNPGNSSLVGNAGDDPAGDKDDKRRDDDKRGDDKKSDGKKSDDEKGGRSGDKGDRGSGGSNGNAGGRSGSSNRGGSASNGGGRSGARGNSGNAGGGTRGNSGSAPPSHSNSGGGTRGNSGSAPGTTGTAPGNTGTHQAPPVPVPPPAGDSGTRGVTPPVPTPAVPAPRTGGTERPLPLPQ